MNITSFPHHKQLPLDLNLPISFEFTEHESALMLMLEHLDYSRFSTPIKGKTGRPRAADAYTMVLILVYARMQGKYSCREVERLCKRDLFLLKILDGRKAPDHCTFDRFIDTHKDALEQLFFQTVGRLDELGELTRDIVYQDGTKMESKAGRYTFVWKRAVEKNLPKLHGHIELLLGEVTQIYEWDLPSCEYEGLLEEIKGRLEALGEPLVPDISGRGHRLSTAQRLYKKTVAYLEKLKNYHFYLASMEGRKSMSKTDNDATFMRMKDDYMRNGQLKPAYNLQVLVDGGYTVGAYASADRTDYATMIPAIDHLHEHIDWRYRGYCADSGYDSQQNFQALEQRHIKAYIKPQNYEFSKTRTFKNDIGRRENMDYHERGDYFICAAGKKLVFKYQKNSTNQYGYTTSARVYHCRRGCLSCTQRKACMKRSRAKYKHVQCNQVLDAYHKQALELISTQTGCEIRVNRSIQAEGVFAQIKSNWGFTRFLRAGMKGAYTEWLLVCLALNVVRLGNRLAIGSIGNPFSYQAQPDSA
jgi:transposase